MHDSRDSCSAEERIARTQRLLTTIDKTLLRLKGESVELTDEELYEGFTEEQVERYQREAAERYDPAEVAESNRRIRKMSKAQWQAVKEQGTAVTQAIADAMIADPRICESENGRIQEQRMKTPMPGRHQLFADSRPCSALFFHSLILSFSHSLTRLLAHSIPATASR